MDKRERFQIFISKLQDAEPASSEDEALELVGKILTSVEDEHSGIPPDNGPFPNDGRMYPPWPDSRRSTDSKHVARYRNRGHNTFIGSNGAIQIIDLHAEDTVIDKAGADGRKVSEL